MGAAPKKYRCLVCGIPVHFDCDRVINEIRIMSIIGTIRTVISFSKVPEEYEVERQGGRGGLSM